MKKLVKLVLAIAAIAGVAYLVITKGDQILSAAKNLLAKCSCCAGEVSDSEPEDTPVAEPAAPVAETDVVAGKEDFVG